MASEGDSGAQSPVQMKFVALLYWLAIDMSKAIAMEAHAAAMVPRLGQQMPWRRPGSEGGGSDTAVASQI